MHFCHGDACTTSPDTVNKFSCRKHTVMRGNRQQPSLQSHSLDQHCSTPSSTSLGVQPNRHKNHTAALRGLSYRLRLSSFQALS
jgi:hypothetical protein